MTDHPKVHASTGLSVETLLKRQDVPAAIIAVFRASLGQIETGEELLWREVAARMTLDALGITPELSNIRDTMPAHRFAAYRRTVNDARRWFTSKFESGDADQVFEAWNGDISPVRKIVAALPSLREPKLLTRSTGVEYVNRNAA